MDGRIRLQLLRFVRIRLLFRHPASCGRRRWTLEAWRGLEQLLRAEAAEARAAEVAVEARTEAVAKAAEVGAVVAHRQAGARARADRT